MDTIRDIMTPEQVSDYLQLSRDTVYRYIREGRLAASRFGRSYRIRKDDVDLLLLATSTGGKARKALFDRIERVCDRNRDIPPEEVERDVAEAVSYVRRSRGVGREKRLSLARKTLG